MRKGRHFKIRWIDSERELRCPPNPDYPDGKDCDARISHDMPSCTCRLPCPAKRCGFWLVDCMRCGQRIGVITAGRPDDPRSVRINCLSG